MDTPHTLHRQHARIAQLVRDQLMRLRQAQLDDADAAVRSLSIAHQQIAAHQRRLALTRRLGLSCAAKQVRSHQRQAVEQFAQQLNTLVRRLNEPSLRIPTLRELMADLAQIHEEFEPPHPGGYPGGCSGGFTFSHRMLCVCTPAIELEDVYLGPFEIQLDLGMLDQCTSQQVYTVMALDAHPAAAGTEITHPHINRQHLCEGDGGLAIRRALMEGRLCDFFLLVTSILQEYNADSAYVELRDWHAIACADCGDTTGEDDSYWCEDCERSYCPSCAGACDRCGRGACLGCLRRCAMCDESFCRHCITACTRCDARACPECLEDQLCVDCQGESDDEEKEEEQQQWSPTTAGAEGQRVAGGPSDGERSRD